MIRASLLCLALFTVLGVAPSAHAAPAASPRADPAPAPTSTPLLAWDDDPPATEVRALTGARTVRVRYGALLPAAFVAELDGERVTTLFHPVPNTVETVELPFIGGRNRLLLCASSPDGLVHLTLERVIVFARLPGDADVEEGARLHSAPELKHELWKQKTPEVAPKPAAPAVAPATAPAATPTTAPPAQAPPRD